MRNKFRKGLAVLSLLTNTSAFVASAKGQTQYSKASGRVENEGAESNRIKRQAALLRKFFLRLICYLPKLLKKKIELNRIGYNIRKKEGELKESKNGKQYFELRQKVDDILKKIFELEANRDVLQEDLMLTKDYIRILRPITDQKEQGTNELKRVLDTRLATKTFEEEFSKAGKILSFISDQDKVENSRKELQKEKENAVNAFKEMLRLIYEDENSKSIEFNKQNFEKFCMSGRREKNEKNKERSKEICDKISENRKIIKNYFEKEKKLKEKQGWLEFSKRGLVRADIKLEEADNLVSNTTEEIKKVVKTVDKYLGNENTREISGCICQIEIAKDLKSKLSYFSTLGTCFGSLLSNGRNLVSEFSEKKHKMSSRLEQSKAEEESYRQQIAGIDQELKELRKNKDIMFSEMVKEEYKSASSIFNDLKVLEKQRDIINEQRLF